MNILNRTSKFSIALALGLMTVMSLSGPAAGHIVVSSHGVTGDYGTIDHPSTPGAKCGYSAENASGSASFRWMKMFPPLVGGRDTTTERDHQQVTFQFKIQRSNNGGPWKNVASSPIQTRIAYDDTLAAFKAMKVYYNGSGFTQDLRGLMIINWIRNGSSEGWVKLVIENYSVKWTVGAPDFVFSEPCSGEAD